MAELVSNVKAGFRDGLDAWGILPSVAPSALKLAVLPLLSIPLAGFVGYGVGDGSGLAAGVLAAMVTALSMLAYVSHLRAQGLATPPVLGVYGRRYFWSFLGAAALVTALQVGAGVAVFAGFALAGANTAHDVSGHPDIRTSDTAAMLLVAGALASALVSTWLFGRLSLALPATAERGSLSISAGWEASKGNATRVLTAAFVASLPVAVLDTVVRAVLPPEIGGLLSALLTLVQVVVVSAALSGVWTATRWR